MMNSPSTCATNGTSDEKKPDLKLEDYEIKQIEINTIASSFGGIGSRLTHLHRYVFNRSGLHTVINLADFVSWCMLYTYKGKKMHS